VRSEIFVDFAATLHSFGAGCGNRIISIGMIARTWPM
jgi:hypothetical protein